MLKLRKGCKVPSAEKLSEGYTYNSSYFKANVGADKIKSLILHFISIHDEPLFFILELPSRLDSETVIRPGVIAARHKDVYYLDGGTREEAASLLEWLSALLINDGMCSFGFGCHRTRDEIMVGKYNVVLLYTRNEKSYDGFFEEHGIYRVENLLTAWDTFTKECPGESFRVDTDGKSVYDIPDMLKDYGLYFAEQREE